MDKQVKGVKGVPSHNEPPGSWVRPTSGRESCQQLRILHGITMIIFHTKNWACHVIVEMVPCKRCNDG